MIKLKDILLEKSPWKGYKKHAVHGKAEVDFLNLISDFPDWKKYNKLTDKGKNVIFFTKKDKEPLVWQTSNGREVQATNLKGDESSYKSYRVGDIYKVLVEGKLNERTGKTGIVTDELFYYHADERLTKIKELAGYLKFDVTKGKHTPEVHKKDSNLKKIFDSIDKLVDRAIKHFKPVSKNWKPSMEEGKLSEGKADQSFNKIIALLRKESRRLNDDDAYELSTKLKKWFNKNVM